MKRAFVMLCALVLLCGLLGCSVRGREYVYISGDILCEVSFEVDNTTYRAEIERSVQGCRIYFHEPLSLKDLELTSDAEGIRAKLCGIEVSGEAYVGLFEVAHFFEFDTRVISSSLDGGTECITLERAVGERFSAFLCDGEISMIDGVLYGERREIKLLRVEGEMLRERK